MRIHIRNADNGKQLRLWLPTGLLLNSFTAGIASKILQKKGIDITVTQMLSLLNTLRDYKKQHPDWVLADMQCADGSILYLEF